MVRNIVVLGGSSHPALNEVICDHLGLPPGNVLLSKFSVGETRVEIGESVRGKDVYIIQTGAGKVNDNLMELLICISACQTASAKRITAVCPLFFYSRQSDVPYNKAGAPLTKVSSCNNKPDIGSEDSPSASLTNGVDGAVKDLRKTQIDDVNGHKPVHQSNTIDSTNSDLLTRKRNISWSSGRNSNEDESSPAAFHARPGYKEWVAQAGTLVADLLTTAGADHVITMDLHDAQYQGFFDIPVDNLYGRPILKRYITQKIPNYQQAVVVSPDAGGAKRATAIADGLGMPFALIHKVSVRLTRPCLFLPLTRSPGTPAHQDHRPPECYHDAGWRRCQSDRDPYRRPRGHIEHHHSCCKATEKGGRNKSICSDHTWCPQR